jgi:uncharacterized delta-60 repeat protein
MGSDDEANAIKLQADGKIILAGTANTRPLPIGSLRDHDADDFALARYNPDGSLDSGFGTNGKVITDFAGFYDQASGVGIQSDGRIVVAGSTVYQPLVGSSNIDMALIRYLSNGAVDASFGTNGKVTQNFPMPPGIFSGDAARAIVIERNDRIVIAGNARTLGGALVRYHPNGSLDLSFGNNGTVVTQDLSQENYFALAVQPDGKPVVAGFGTPLGGKEQFVVARFDGGGPPFDFCIQDDSNGNLLQIDTISGAYLFIACGGPTIGGVGTVARRGGLLTLQYAGGDRRVMVTIDTTTRRATASVQILSQHRTFNIVDSNINDNTCACK